jgi:hypothetical protein
VIRSAPSGASVTINGKWNGRTPIVRDGLAWGDYNVRVVMPGYETHQERINLSTSNASRVLSYQLQREAGRATAPTPRPEPAPARPQAAPAAPLPATGALDIDSRPTGARVFMDDRPIGTTPMKLPDVSPGSHVIRMELPDHRAWSETTQVVRGKTTRVAGSLEPIR